MIFVLYSQYVLIFVHDSIYFVHYVDTNLNLIIFKTAQNILNFDMGPVSLNSANGNDLHIHIHAGKGAFSQRGSGLGEGNYIHVVP